MIQTHEHNCIFVKAKKIGEKKESYKKEYSTFIFFVKLFHEDLLIIVALRQKKKKKKF